MVPLSEAEDTEDVTLQAIEEYPDFIGASLELVAVFDDGLRFPIELVGPGDEVEPS